MKKLLEELGLCLFCFVVVVLLACLLNFKESEVVFIAVNVNTTLGYHVMCDFGVV